MSLTAQPIDNRRISRKLAINLDHHTVNVRPVIKVDIKPYDNLEYMLKTNNK